MSTYVSIQSRGTIALPAALRKQFRLDEPGAQVEIIAEGDHIVLRPMLPIPASQAWYWRQQSLEGEARADDEAASGLGEQFDSDEAFLGSFDR